MRPSGACLSTLLLTLCFCLTQVLFGESAARKVEIDGQKAKTLISLLSSGNQALQQAVAREKEFAIADFYVIKGATQKYYPVDSLFGLDLYAAWGKIGNSQNPSEIGEATAIYQFLTNLGFRQAVSLQGSDHSFSRIECKINATIHIRAPKRFQCSLTEP